MGVGSTELGKILGISRQRVNELGRQGKIRREADGKWNVEAAKRALAANLDNRQPSPTLAAVAKGPKVADIGKHRKDRPAPTEETGETPRKGTQAYENWRLTREKANREELERHVREGELLEKSEVIEQVGSLLVNAKTCLRGIGAKIAPDLAAETSAAKCQQMIDAEIDEALTAASKWKPTIAKRT